MKKGRFLSIREEAVRLGIPYRLTLREVAARLGISYRRVRRKIKIFGVPTERIGCTIMIDEKYLETLSEEERTWGRKVKKTKRQKGPDDAVVL